MSLSANPFLLKNSFKSTLCEILYQDILSRRSNLYYFLGKTLPPNIDDIPADISDSLFEESEIRKDIIGVKKVTPSDISFVVPRYDWIPNVSYDMYDSDISLVGKKYYVINSNFDVYKCLDNNANGLSTVQPFGTEISPIKTTDGYIWKYMYSIPLALRNKFMNERYIPVATAFSKHFYSDGAILDVIVTNQGNNYFGESNVDLEVDSATGVGAVIKPVIDTETGKINEVIVVEGGSGYLDTDTDVTILDFSQSPGTGAVLQANVEDGKVTKVFVKRSGSGYSSDLRTVITVQGDGEGTKLLPYIENGKLKDIIIENPGTGYTFANIDIFCKDASSASAEVVFNQGSLDPQQSLIEQTAINGGIHVVKILNQGLFYTFGSFTIDGDGTGLELSPILSNGSLISVTVVNPGSGYTYANITFEGNGQGAEVKAIISPLGGHGSNAIKELNANTLCIFSSVSQEKFNGVIVNNDFRQYGLLKDPEEFTTNNPLTRLFGSSMYYINLSSTVNINKDNIIMINNKEYVVVELIANSVLVLGINNSDIININDVVSLTNSTSTYTVTDILSSPQVNRFSGEMLFVSNNPGINFSEEQFITLKTYITM